MGPVLVPVLEWLVIPFAVFVGYLAAKALKASFHYTLGPLLDSLSILLRITIPFVHYKIDLSGPIQDIKHAIEESISTFLAAFEMPIGRFFEQLTRLSRGQVDAINYQAAATAQTVHNLVHSTIPVTVRDRTDPLTHAGARTRSGSLARDREEARKRAAGLEAGVRDLHREKIARERGIDNVKGQSKAYTDAQAGRLEGQIAKERAYSHKVLGGRLSLLERLLGVGVIGGVAAAVLTRLFPYWQCSNVRRFMRGLCRSPIGALDWLFALAALAALSLNPDPVVKALPYAQDVFGGLADDFVGLMRHRADPADVARADARG